MDNVAKLHILVQKYQDKNGTGSIQFKELPDGRLVLNVRKERTVLSGITIDMAVSYLSSRV